MSMAHRPLAVTAPFDGVVVRRSVERGAMALPGMPLLVVEETSNYRLEVTVDAGSGTALRRGSKARVALDALPERDLEGAVSELEAGADPNKQAKVTSLTTRKNADHPTGGFTALMFATRNGDDVTIHLEIAAVKDEPKADAKPADAKPADKPETAKKKSS